MWAAAAGQVAAARLLKKLLVQAPHLLIPRAGGRGGAPAPPRLAASSGDYAQPGATTCRGGLQGCSELGLRQQQRDGGGPSVQQPHSRAGSCR
jgi:hypothetical protein